MEIYDGGTWGTVCDNQWDMDDAAVVCRQLGYSRAVAARSSAYYGQGSGTIKMTNVQCLGSETKLQHCKSSQWNSHTHNCNHSQDAGVECGKILVKLHIRKHNFQRQTFYVQVDAIKSGKTSKIRQEYFPGID